VSGHGKGRRLAGFLGDKAIPLVIAVLASLESERAEPGVATYEVVLVDHVPTERECDDSTVRQSGLRRDRARVGLQMCARTNQNRWAYGLDRGHRLGVTRPRVSGADP
jgi:hypothetical protein